MAVPVADFAIGGLVRSDSTMPIAERPEIVTLIGQSPEFRGLVQDKSESNLAQADVSSIAYSIYDLTNGRSVLANHDGVALTVANVVYDTLQTWDADADGYNFAFQVTSNVPFTQVGTGYDVDVVFTLTSGEADVVAGWRVRVES